MATLFLNGLTNFISYDTNEEMQSIELIDINPGKLVYSKEETVGGPYYFTPNLSNIPDTALISDTGEGYWIPYTGDFIYIDNFILTPTNNIPIEFNEIYIGNINNEATSTAITGNITLESDGVMTINNNIIGSEEMVNMGNGYFWIGNDSGIATLTSISSDSISLSNTGITAIKDNSIITDYFSDQSIPGSRLTDLCITTDKFQSGAIRKVDLVVGIRYTWFIYLIHTLLLFSTSRNVTLSVDNVLSTDIALSIINSVANVSYVINTTTDDGSVTINFDAIPETFSASIFIFRQAT
jgi:hypothetical protein